MSPFFFIVASLSRPQANLPTFLKQTMEDEHEYMKSAKEEAKDIGLQAAEAKSKWLPLFERFFNLLEALQNSWRDLPRQDANEHKEDYNELRASLVRETNSTGKIKNSLEVIEKEAKKLENEVHDQGNDIEPNH